MTRVEIVVNVPNKSCEKSLDVSFIKLLNIKNFLILKTTSQTVDNPVYKNFYFKFFDRISVLLHFLYFSDSHTFL